jgi:hypothetical protein
LERAREVWLRRHNGGTHLSRMDIVALCWDPKIAVQPEFVSVLAGQASLGGRAIRGLLASYHEEWPPQSGELQAAVALGLASLERCRGLLMQWRSSVSQLLGTDAPTKFARACVAEKVSVTARATVFGLSSTSGFARGCAEAVAGVVTSPGYASLQVEYALKCFFVEDNALLTPISWGRAFESLVTSDRLLLEGLDRQRLVDLALQVRGLPDPRIRSAGWQNIPPAARQRIVHWLSEEDLRFFFDLIMEGQSDPQGRRPFWMNYVSKARRARVVVGEADHTRLRSQLAEIQTRGRSYARMRQRGTGDWKVSAFIMDFGNVTVVEFSRINSACYFYTNEENEPYIDLSAHGFSLSHLKNTRRANWYPHRGRWENKFRQRLAEYGVRPQ